MILTYDSLDDALELQILEDDYGVMQKKTIAADWAQRIPRFDLIKEIATFLDEAKLQPTSITKIAFVHGPGRFTAVRTACIIANAFARTMRAQLYPVHKTILAEHNSDFSFLLRSEQIATVEVAVPIFDASPRIHSK